MNLKNPLTFIIQDCLAVINLICCYGSLTIQSPHPCYHDRKAGIPHDRNILLLLLNNIIIFTTTVGTATAAAAIIIIIIIVVVVAAAVVVIIITFTRGIYNYIHETNHVSRLYNVAATLQLQYMVHVMLFPMIKMYFYVSISSSTSAI
jgi:hypothetical protein